MLHYQGYLSRLKFSKFHFKPTNNTGKIFKRNLTERFIKFSPLYNTYSGPI